MKTKTILTLLFALAVFASVFLCPVAQAKQLPWNVEADVTFGDVVFHYSLKQEMIGCNNAQPRAFFGSLRQKQALAQHLQAMQLPNSAIFNYILPNFDKILHCFRFVERQKQDATVSFDQSGFHYTEGQNGVYINQLALFNKMLQGEKTIKLPTVTDAAVTVPELKQKTTQKGSFSTTFFAGNTNRLQNVVLAAQALDGTVVGSGEKFSFNKTVGPRTAERGYRSSKVIVDGAYVDGVGGGVCQVSTTLYNALLLAEFLPSACQHSLVSSYVEAGFDAMVSDGGADLTFTNTTACPVYVSAKVNESSQTITCTVFGLPNACKVVRESVAQRTPFEVVEIFDAQKYPDIIYCDQFKVLSGGSDGVVSQSFLNYYDGNRLVKRLKIRQNSYKMVNKVVVRGILPRPEVD